MRYLYALILFLGALFLVPDLADAENHTILVGTDEDAYVFSPSVLRILPGPLT